MMPRYDYRIAAGHNVPLANLVNIETIIPSGDRRFYPPRSFGTYSPGAIRVRADGRLYFAGFPSLTWKFSILTIAQFKYLQTTYCNNSYSGKVTIYTKLDDNSTYVRCNAIMVLPVLNTLDTSAFRVFKDVNIEMRRIEVI